MNRPELHDVLRRWRALAGARDGAEPVLVGETYVLDLEQLIPFYGLGEDELHLAFNFLFFHCDLDAGADAPDRRGHGGEAARGRLAGVDRLQPRRQAARDALGRRRPARTRAALLMLLGLRGTPFLYYGDEIGLPDTPLDPARRARPGRGAASATPRRTATSAARRCSGATSRAAASPGRRARRGCRSATSRAHNVAAQREDPGSILHLVRDLIALRREREDLRGGAYETLPAPDGAWAWRRGDGDGGGA